MKVSQHASASLRIVAGSVYGSIARVRVQGSRAHRRFFYPWSFMQRRTLEQLSCTCKGLSDCSCGLSVTKGDAEPHSARFDIGKNALRWSLPLLLLLSMPAFAPVVHAKGKSAKALYKAVQAAEAKDHYL